MTWSLDGNSSRRMTSWFWTSSRTITGNVRFIFATTVGSENYLNLEPYFQLEGLTYRIVPIHLQIRKAIWFPVVSNTNIMYNNVMTKFAYRVIWINRKFIWMKTTCGWQRISALTSAVSPKNSWMRTNGIPRSRFWINAWKWCPTRPFITTISVWFKIAELYYRAAGAYNRQDTLMANDMEINQEMNLSRKPILFLKE